MKKELLETYEYFSHNLRTCTSTIVATLEALKMEIISINDEEMKNVYESAYILDILDISLSICIDHLVMKDIENTDYELNLMKLIKTFLAEQSNLIKLNELTINIEGEDTTIVKNGYILKYLLQLILFEAIKNTNKELYIAIQKNKIIIDLKNHKDTPPKIFNLLSTILEKHGILFTYSDNNYMMELII